MLICTDVAPARANDALPVTNPDARLCVQPFTPVDDEMLPAVVRGITYIYGFDVRVLDPVPLPDEAYHEPRKRWRADKLLDWMNGNLAAKHSSCRWFVGFTEQDISTTKPPHADWGVLGLGEVGGRIAMVSSFRTHKKLRKPHTALRRTVKTVNHEIGHLMGLPHQPGETCLMQDAEGSVLTTDKETGLLCEPTVEFIERERGLRIPRHEEMEWGIVE